MKTKGHNNSTTFKEQNRRATEILNTVVRPQVKVYELFKANNSPNNIKLTPAQKAQLSVKGSI